MATEEELVQEIKKLNQSLTFLVNPWKNASREFSAGIWRSLGSMFGTIVISAVLVYIFSQLNVGTAITRYFQKIMPTPQVNVTMPILTPGPDQP